MTKETNPTSNVVPLKAAKKCVKCSKKATQTYAPFCSKRCADLDLGKWLDGSYAFVADDQDGRVDEE